MITQEKIKRGGSKLEITREVLESGLDIPVPVSAWRYYGDDLTPLVNAYQGMKKPVIVRGSHQNDYHGFIDVVPTIRDVDSINKLENAVRVIEEKVKSEEVRIHCEDWKQPFTPEVHILMQEQSLSPINGIILRHPHSKEGYYVQYRDINDISVYRNPISHARQNTPLDDFFEAESYLGISDDNVKQAIIMFQKLESSGVLEKDWAYQIEFGLNPLLFFQARPFKRFEPVANFEIPFFKNAIQSMYVFGITPPEGIDLDFLVCNPGRLSNSHCFNLKRNDFPQEIGLSQICRFSPDYSPAIDLKLGDLKCFYSPCNFHNFLFHENYRFMKKADVSFLNSTSQNVYENFRGRVISNGEEGIIIPLK